MEPVVLFRNIPPSPEVEEEMEIARRYFKVETVLTKCQNALVIPRFSCLPYYREFYDNLLHLGSFPINHWKSHNWIADFHWYKILEEFTPKSWDDTDFPYSDYQGPFVLKGVTNSRKHQWSTHMFAPTRKDAIRIASELRNDMHLASQPVIYREYVPLRTFEIGINGIPFSNEWRFFCYDKYILTYGYYWCGLDDLTLPNMNQRGLDFAQSIVDKLNEDLVTPVDFYVLDIAEKQNGDWILIEVNDASMSGLSMNDPDKLYSNLKEVFNWEDILKKQIKEIKNGGN